MVAGGWREKQMCGDLEAAQTGRRYLHVCREPSEKKASPLLHYWPEAHRENAVGRWGHLVERASWWGMKAADMALTFCCERSGGLELPSAEIFGTLLLCQQWFFCSNPWQTRATSIQTLLFTYKGLCSLTGGGVEQQQLNMVSHTPSPPKTRVRKSTHASN